MMSKTIAVFLLAAACVAGSPADALAQSAKTLYTRALDRERTLRDSPRKPTLKQMRAAVAAYEAIVRRYPTSGYSDNALWQAANLSFLAYDEYGQSTDRRAGLRLLSLLRKEYPSSSLVARAREIGRDREAAPPPAPVPASAAAPERTAPREKAEIRDVKRTVLPDGIRLTIELDRETVYYSERLDGPKRVFFDLKGATAAASLLDATLKFDDDLVREVRFGRHPEATRVVMDMEGAVTFPWTSPTSSSQQFESLFKRAETSELRGLTTLRGQQSPHASAASRLVETIRIAQRRLR